MEVDSFINKFIKSSKGMQGISAKEHESMLEGFRKFEYLSLKMEDKVLIKEDTLTREGMAELTETYNRFRVLLSELETCTKEYSKQRKFIQSVMYKRIRKMNTEINKRSHK